ncbi:fungal-specific transcription factor domain-containing protein [Aspergillus keveii]|uniref:Fungal-specific transcription factor domain-containing protein n=1 Tax=Aspergillus keveii TaxID=714993 RepID=A0ABR4G3C3_9EURO
MAGNQQTSRPTPDDRRSPQRCQPCRGRKRNCDEVQPTCTFCARDNLVCQWPDTIASSNAPQLRHGRKSRRDLSRGRQATPALVGISVSVFTASSMRTLSRLFSHFTQYGPMWMSIGPGGRRQTCFLSQLVPIAMQSPPVLSCIFAAAATDLAKYNGGKDDLEVFALEMHSRALGEVNGAVSQEIIGETLAGVDGRSDALLLAVLLLCFHESHNFSDNTRLIPHLNAAATLAWRCLQWPPANVDLRNFLIDLFCYFFALAAFSHGESLLSEAASQVFARVLAASEQDDMLLLGPGQQLLSVIFRVSTLAMHAPTALEYKSRRFELLRAERNLQYWQVSDPTAREALRIPTVPCNGPAGGLSHHGSSRDDDHDDAGPDRMRIFEIYRLACLLFVRRTLYPHAPLCGADMQEIISSVIAQVNLLPESSPANGVLVWPLVVVGVCSLDDVHQRAITARLRSIYRTWRSDILRRNIEFLWAHWKRLRCARRNRHSAGLGPACRSPGDNGHHACCAGGGAGNFTFQGLGFPTILV